MYYFPACSMMKIELGSSFAWLEGFLVFPIQVFLRSILEIQTNPKSPRRQPFASPFYHTFSLGNEASYCFSLPFPWTTFNCLPLHIRSEEGYPGILWSLPVLVNHSAEQSPYKILLLKCFSIFIAISWASASISPTGTWKRTLFRPSECSLMRNLQAL